MARGKAPRPPRPAKQQARRPPQHHAPPHEEPPHEEHTTRRFLNRGVQVQIDEAPDRVALTLDGVPIEVSVDRGEYFAHVAHMFTGFGSIDALVDHLLANEGRTWTLHGHVCDERCRGGVHHHGHGSGHGHGHDHDHNHRHHDHEHGAVAPDRRHDHPTGAAPDAYAAGSRPQRATHRTAQRPPRKPPRRGGTR